MEARSHTGPTFSEWYGIVNKSSFGLRKEKTIFKASLADDLFPSSWSPDDSQIVCTYQSPNGSHVSLVSIADGKSIVFNLGKGNQSNGQVSHDGKWLAYASDESGQWEVYVTTFPAAAVSGKSRAAVGPSLAGAEMEKRSTTLALEVCLRQYRSAAKVHFPPVNPCRCSSSTDAPRFHPRIPLLMT